MRTLPTLPALAVLATTGLATLGLAACGPSEHVLLLELTSERDVAELSEVLVLSLDQSRPPVTTSAQPIGRSVEELRLEPLRVPVALPFPARILVHVTARSAEGSLLFATRCYDVRGVIRDDVLLIDPLVPPGGPDVDPDEDTFVADAARFCFDAGEMPGERVPCDFACPAERADDCGPGDPERRPGASPDPCDDDVDQDCDGMLPEVCGDADGDGWLACRRSDPLGSCDCDDSVASINPGVEDCSDDGVDQNCDGLPAFCDRDGDGFAAESPTGGEPDCNDDPMAGGADDNPLAEEVCDGRDNDCNGLRDDNPDCRTTDADGDGAMACEGEPDGVCDCNDCNAFIVPTRSEDCGNGVDDNCNGEVDEGCPPDDLDGDGVPAGRDCDDRDPRVFPGSEAPDRCEDGLATNCLPGGDLSCDDDEDGDGFVNEGLCEGEGNAEQNPLAVERCNLIDDNCSGVPDDLAPVRQSEAYPYGVLGCIDRFGVPDRIDFRASLEHCGGCGVACPADRADLCADGACDCAGEADVGVCGEGDTCCGDGCVDLATDVNNCGACGQTCGTGEACLDGRCTCGDLSAERGQACPPPSGTSGRADPNHCCDERCTDIRTDLDNCDGCGQLCRVDNGTGACVDGDCRVAACDPGFDDCAGLAESCQPLNTLDDCGRCGQACTVANGTATCRNRVCELDRCNARFQDCDGSVDCETPIDDLDNCSGCGIVCAQDNATPRCRLTGNTAVCEVETCDDGFADCTAASGCETDIRTAANCGGCSIACGANARCNGVQRCVCLPNFLDCDGSTGCEQAVGLSHCGQCNTACGAGEECDLARVRCTCGAIDGPIRNGPACGSGETCCTDDCVDLENDPTNCGECGNACGPDETCGAGRFCACGPEVASGLGPICGVDDTCCEADGCVDVTSDARHCGGCDVACDADARCDASECVCPALDPDAPCGDGETCCGDGCFDLQSDPMRCGSCGASPCDGACVDGVCDD